MGLYMSTTQIATEKTLGEIQSLLAGTGRVKRFVLDYNQAGQVEACCFGVEIGPELVPFRLPVNTMQVFNLLQRKRSPRFRARAEEQDLKQSHRTAWRIILRWVQAQIALIETGMVELEEVFMPYVQLGVKETLFQKFVKDVESGRGRFLTHTN